MKFTKGVVKLYGGTGKAEKERRIGELTIMQRQCLQ